MRVTGRGEPRRRSLFRRSRVCGRHFSEPDGARVCLLDDFFSTFVEAQGISVCTILVQIRYTSLGTKLCVIVCRKKRKLYVRATVACLFPCCDLDHCGVFFGVLFAGAHKNSPGTHHPESRQCEPSARDRTTYGRARYSTRQFYLHHTRLIAKAAVIHDAMGISRAGPGPASASLRRARGCERLALDRGAAAA